MLYKPAGVVSATRDKVSRTVLDLITDRQRKDLFPVGRLDKDTEGLLLITNDGELAHQLLSPRKHVDKVYYAKVKGKVTGEDTEAFLEGVMIEEDYRTLPAKLTILVSDAVSEVELTIQEGRFHQVKRMFEAVGKEVIYLKRLSMGSLRLDEGLKPGEYRELTKEEIALLKNTQ
jgi:16S rRNA pseudouridine516 synthase